eukprot:scaffold54569_cov18-Tisochrysis_lutea.AAC.1
MQHALPAFGIHASGPALSTMCWLGCCHTAVTAPCAQENLTNDNASQKRPRASFEDQIAYLAGKCIEADVRIP